MSRLSHILSHVKSSDSREDQFSFPLAENSQPFSPLYDFDESPVFNHHDHDYQQSNPFLNLQKKVQMDEIISVQDLTEKSQIQLPPKHKKIRKADGCGCKKNECGNQYCGCAKFGKKCGTNCECKNCKNHSFFKVVRCKVGEFWMHSWEYKHKKRTF